MLKAVLRILKAFYARRGLEKKCFPLSRRHAESMNAFSGLHARLARENQLHALMLSQRYFRKAKK